MFVPHCTCRHPFYSIKMCFEMINPFTPRVSYGHIKVVLTFDSVDELLWCDYSNETLSAVILHGTIYI